jgi:RNA polymerase sigma-70 factor (ECF subfamily)
MEKLENLVKQAKSNDNMAFREIFEILHARVFSYTCSHVESREDAMDIAQEAFIDLWKGLKKFEYRTDEEFYGFAFLIVKKKIARFYKRKRNTMSLEETEMDVGFTEEHEDHRFLLRHIADLSEKYQEVLRLRYWGGMKLAEVAMVLGIDEGTAKVRHHRALMELRGKMDR